MKTLLASVAMLLALTATSTAAEIFAKKVKGLYVVVVKGDIEKDDDDVFKAVTSKLPSGNTLVAFNSDGGSVVAGLNIGLMIRAKRFATFVPADALCASVCGLAWLAGAPRLVTSESRVGFHGAYNSETKQATSGGNALAGAYLARLGFSYDAIYTLTTTKPDEMLWMTATLANKLGIKHTVLKD